MFALNRSTGSDLIDALGCFDLRRFDLRGSALRVETSSGVPSNLRSSFDSSIVRSYRRVILTMAPRARARRSAALEDGAASSR